MQIIIQRSILFLFLLLASSNSYAQQSALSLRITGVEPFPELALSATIHFEIQNTSEDTLVIITPDDAFQNWYQNQFYELPDQPWSFEFIEEGECANMSEGTRVEPYDEPVKLSLSENHLRFIYPGETISSSIVALEVCDCPEVLLNGTFKVNYKVQPGHLASEEDVQIILQNSSETLHQIVTDLQSIHYNTSMLEMYQHELEKNQESSLLITKLYPATVETEGVKIKIAE